MTSEDDCSCCGHWPKAERASLRPLLIDKASLVTPVCTECYAEFCRTERGMILRGMIRGQPTKPTKH